MATRSPAHQTAFRYRPIDSATGVTRDTAKRLAEHLGVDETQAIHLALHDMAVRLLPQYEADEGPLTTAQLRQIKKARTPGREAVGAFQPVRGGIRMTSQWWAEPAAGEMVWCHFPDDISPRPKPRPALILAVFDDDALLFTVRVALWHPPANHDPASWRVLHPS